MEKLHLVHIMHQRVKQSSDAELDASYLRENIVRIEYEIGLPI